jgi:hypothetical protein
MVFSRSRLWVRRDDSIHALAVRRTLAGHDPALTPGELTESAESAESAEAAGAAGAAGGTRWQSLGDAALYVADRGPSLVAVGRLAVLAGAGFAPVCSPPAGWQAPADFPLVPARCRHTLTGACARTTLRRPGDPAPAERALCRS